ncbi:MAG: hypothetical protein ACOYOT_03795 [Bacteroidales bacterium]
MKHKQVLFLLFLLTTLMACRVDSKKSNSMQNVSPVDDQHWPLTVNNGKGFETHYTVKPMTDLIGDYIDNVTQIDDELAFSLSDDKNYKNYLSKDSLRIDSIGVWGRYSVFQISNLFVMHRSVILKANDGKYRFLYTESEHVGSPKTGTIIYGDGENSKPLSFAELRDELRPQLIMSGNQQVLKLKYFVGGNSEYYEYIYWAIDKTSNLPKEIKL